MCRLQLILPMVNVTRSISCGLFAAPIPGQSADHDTSPEPGGKIQVHTGLIKQISMSAGLILIPALCPGVATQQQDSVSKKFCNYLLHW